MQNSVEIEVGGSLLKIEAHRWAKQSNGSVVVTYGDNVILVTANMKDEAREDQDFFPLMVDFRENNYAAGKIPGGFFKREGRPSEREILLSRLIDRPIRPLFPEGFQNETQVIALLLSADFSLDYDSMGIIGASAALLSSTIPFDTPLGAVKIGHKDGGFIINPGYESLKEMEMVIQLAGTENDAVMIESVGTEFSEELFKEAIRIGKAEIKKICLSLKLLTNPDKLVVEEDIRGKEIFENLSSKYSDRFKEMIFTDDRIKRKTLRNNLVDEIMESIEVEDETGKFKEAIHKIEYHVFRKQLLAEKRRSDGRAYDKIRDINIELGILPRVHGSAVFTRGETQALATVTLGAEDDAQRIDNLSSEGGFKKFMLHYNFPPFSVGEVSFLRGAGRREIGHGSLAEKALLQVMPDEESFLYTVRLVSDILESNGSSSMATVCGGSLALMEAGVPVKAPVSGIAMGLVKEGDEFAVLTDIAGYEDHFGDMDFKIAGTEKGITAVQLDIKIGGLSDEIIEKTLQDAKVARLFILDKMKTAIAKPSQQLSQYAPVITSMRIKQEKIKDLIGPGGKTIKDLIARFNVKINADQEGNVTIAAPNQAVGIEVMERITELTKSVEMGKVYTGKVTRIEDYGFFAEILPGVTGLVHVSEISHQRTRDVRSVVKMGQILEAKVIGIDRDNKVKLSLKALQPKEDHRPDHNKEKN